MKKMIFTLAFTVQVIMGLAANRPALLVTPRQENIKMFLQAGTSTPVLQVLSSKDHITHIRRHNKDWELVQVNGKAGYVLRSEIVFLDFRNGQVVARNKKCQTASPEECAHAGMCAAGDKGTHADFEKSLQEYIQRQAAEG